MPENYNFVTNGLILSAIS
ncbi:hypothetical protein [Erwinia phyllosphaerae]|nr:hypothetical protein [Erwinia phyllosphaerae]